MLFGGSTLIDSRETSMLNQYPSEGYALRDLQNTDLLAFRCVAENGLPRGARVLDLGCGAGRSARFLRDLGKSVVGVDRRPDMIAAARQRDCGGDYELTALSQPLPFVDGSFDAVFSSWALVEEASRREIVRVLRECHRVLRPGGQAVIVTNTPEFYMGNWLSCEVEKNSPTPQSGQPVKATLLPERVVVSDYFWSDADYRAFFAAASFTVRTAHRPLGRPEDSLPWKDERRAAPYVIYELARL